MTSVSGRLGKGTQWTAVDTYHEPAVEDMSSGEFWFVSEDMAGHELEEVFGVLDIARHGGGLPVKFQSKANLNGSDPRPSLAIWGRSFSAQSFCDG